MGLFELSLDEVTSDQEQDIVEQHLRKSGFRWTSQRALIVRLALETHDHFTAEELLGRCRGHSRSGDTYLLYTLYIYKKYLLQASDPADVRSPPRHGGTHPAQPRQGM